MITCLVRGDRVRDISGLDMIHELLAQRDDAQRCHEPGDPDWLTTEFDPMSKAYLKEAVPAAQVAQALSGVRETVASVIADIRERGDEAVREYSAKFDSWSPDSFRLSAAQVEDIIAGLPAQVIDDITFVQAQVRGFAQAQLASMTEIEVETLPGVFLGHKHLPVECGRRLCPRRPLPADRVGAHDYPDRKGGRGGTGRRRARHPSAAKFPPPRLPRCTWPGQTRSTSSAACRRSTALALGTETVGKVDLIAGPGNAYVAEAKRQLFGEVGIDLFAGPTEILVIADETADPEVVAVDLLSPGRARPRLARDPVTTSRALGETVLALRREDPARRCRPVTSPGPPGGTTARSS